MRAKNGPGENITDDVSLTRIKWLIEEQNWPCFQHIFYKRFSTLHWWFSIFIMNSLNALTFELLIAYLRFMFVGVFHMDI